jgi:hypothetical protein
MVFENGVGGIPTDLPFTVYVVVPFTVFETAVTPPAAARISSSVSGRIEVCV